MSLGSGLYILYYCVLCHLQGYLLYHVSLVHGDNAWKMAAMGLSWANDAFMCTRMRMLPLVCVHARQVTVNSLAADCPGGCGSTHRFQELVGFGTVSMSCAP